MNLLSLPLREDGIRFGGSTVKISRAAREAAGGDGDTQPLTVRTYGREEGLRGKTIRVIARQEAVHLFHPTTGERLPD
ncbi:hypothetical protein ACFVX6_04595 [Streptomyces sp. NPDC058289]|uniref:hypothetical protein n=1 Tax=Streptomyces sp. NPDC058289 TaxID=3346425 RepID=UPI0036E7F9F6